MKFKNEKFSAEFSVSDKLTVRQHLQYSSMVAGSEKEDLAQRYFEAAAKFIVSDWQCEKLPDLNKVDLDAPMDSAESSLIADIMIWVGMEVRRHINALDIVPKK